MTTLGTSADQIAVSGIAADNVGVVQVSWATSTGAEGVANGRENWTINSIPLLRGNNVIVVRATDAAGNIGWRAFSVTRR